MGSAPSPRIPQGCPLIDDWLSVSSLAPLVAVQGTFDPMGGLEPPSWQPPGQGTGPV